MSSSNYCFLPCTQIPLIIIKVKDGDGHGPGNSGRDGEKRSGFGYNLNVQLTDLAGRSHVGLRGKDLKTTFGPMQPGGWSHYLVNQGR